MKTSTVILSWIGIALIGFALAGFGLPGVDAETTAGISGYIVGSAMMAITITAVMARSYR